MVPAVLLLLMLAAAAPLLLTAQSLDYNSMAKPSTTWINNVDFFNSYNYYVRNILNIEQPQSYPGVAPYITAGFLCIFSHGLDPCDKFFFGVSIGNDRMLSPQQQMVWSANRDHPVRENATLKFTTDGNLVLRDADGTHVWSSNTSGQSVEGMKITEIGNLVLFDHMNATVWQSFDNPTDTLVPGQSLLEGMRLTTTTSATNKTGNQFYITVRSDGLYAFVDSQLYFSFTMMRGNKKGNDPAKVTFVNGKLSISGTFTDTVDDRSILLPESEFGQYMRLESDGHLRLYEFDLSRADWTMAYDVMQLDDCDYPTVCREYGVCTEGQCTCPLENNSSSSYFKPVDEQKPNLGCTPLNPISCQEIRHHKLLTIPRVSYFDYSPTVVDATSIDECKQACLNNCSCMAVLFRDGESISDGECVWLTEVLSLHSIQPETSSYHSIVYLKVQLSPSNENKKKLMLGATLGAVTTLVLLIIVVTLYLQKRIKYEEKDEEFDFDQFARMPTRYSFQKLSECTEGFSRKLGEGGFGSVFEGKLAENRVAVKRLEGARQGKKEFLAEVETIGSIEHINLVGLIGFCIEKSERLLVYEYMSRGSLDRWIYYCHNNAPLDWCTRCRIIMDIAKGLCYLHEECKRKIAHLDIKPQNILLDENFNAKVADFGLCKLINRDQSKVFTVMRGTPGYLAPEWLTSPITEKVDVYSFGVVIMEIISGRKNIDNSQPEGDVHLINLLQEKEQTNELIDLIDKHSDDMVSRHEEVIRMMKLAVWCLQHDCTRRPSMSTVVKVLEGLTQIETFDANSIMFVQDKPSAYSAPSQASILSGPR